MTQDEIIEMVNQVGCVSYSPPPLRAVAGASMTFAQLDALIKLAAAKEREACKKACEDERNDPDDQFKNYEDTHTDGWIDGCNSCISAIVARGEA